MCVYVRVCVCVCVMGRAFDVRVVNVTQTVLLFGTQQFARSRPLTLNCHFTRLLTLSSPHSRYFVAVGLPGGGVGGVRQQQVADWDARGCSGA
jgi:hypothetical protein